MVYKLNVLYFCDLTQFECCCVFWAAENVEFLDKTCSTAFFPSLNLLSFTPSFKYWFSSCFPSPISDQDGGISLPDQFGRHRRVNGTWIDREYETHIAIEKRDDQQMKWCIISDEIARQIMGYTDAEWAQVAGPTGKITGNMSAEMAKLFLPLIAKSVI